MMFGKLVKAPSKDWSHFSMTCVRVQCCGAGLPADRGLPRREERGAQLCSMFARRGQICARLRGGFGEFLAGLGQV